MSQRDMDNGKQVYQSPSVLMGVFQIFKKGMEKHPKSAQAYVKAHGELCLRAKP